MAIKRNLALFLKQKEKERRGLFEFGDCYRLYDRQKRIKKRGKL